MISNRDQNPPDEERIEQLLRGFKPAPTQRYNTRMAAAPWMKASRQPVSRIRKIELVNRKRLWAVAALILISLILGIAFLPSARVAADQIIHLFLPERSNQLEVELNKPGDVQDFSNPANFPMTIKIAQDLVDFPLKELPAYGDLTFIGARYDSIFNTVTFLYRTDNYDLYLVQRPLGKGKDLFSIGAEAQVDLVDIGGNQGEYVTGGWKAISTQPAPASKISAIWDNNVDQSILRWVVNGIVYELRCSGNQRLNQSELIFLANELK